MRRSCSHLILTSHTYVVGEALTQQRILRNRPIETGRSLTTDYVRRYGSDALTERTRKFRLGRAGSDVTLARDNRAQ